MSDKLTNLLLAVCALENDGNNALLTAIMQQMQSRYTHIALSLLQNVREDSKCEHGVQPKVRREEWVATYCDEEFRSNFRLTRQCFDELLHVLSTEYNTSRKYYCGGNMPITVTRKLYITLWYLAKQDPLTAIAERFGVVTSTVKEAVDEMVRDIASLASRYIVWPTAEECAIVEEKFRRKGGLAGVIGALDSCLINVTLSKDQQKSGRQVIVQAVCTSELLFTDVFVALPNEVHEEEVLASSGLYKTVHAKGSVELFHDTYCVVANSMYPTREWLLTPYKDFGNLTDKKRKFNCKHTYSCTFVQRCFELLKGRWHRLLRVNRTDMAKVSHVIVACCVLHNLCRRNYDDLEDCEPVQLLQKQQILDEDCDEAVQLGILHRISITNNI